MNNNIKSLLWLSGFALALASCSQELPFEGPSAEGYLNLKATGMEVRNADILNETRATNINIGDFRVEILNKDTKELVQSYRYSEMPEIVTLPVGEYEVNAIYGENHPNKWENPYYLGDTEFSIESGKITDNLEPVICKLSNIRIKVKFGPNLTAKMSPDSKVEVRVGQTGSLDYTKNDQDRAGYFAFTPGSQTITATFKGRIDGDEVSETKTYDNAAAGNIYGIDFRLHDPDGSDDGEISGSINVDASITHVDITENIDPNENHLEDDMRPQEDQGDDPTPPNPPVEQNGPSITAQEPINLDGVNTVSDDLTVILNISTEAEGGITKFLVNIDSEQLTPELLEGVRLASEFDLVDPGNLAEGLEALGLPINVGGWKEVEFNITSFMPLLQIYPGVHKFHLTVTDANGTSKATLTLEVK